MISLAVAACVRNEAPYIQEWIEFHRLQGVEKFFLYDNDSTDKTLSVLAPYIDTGIADVTFWPRRPAQQSAFDDALDVTRRFDVQWCAFIDVDEFLFSPSGVKLPETLKQFEKHPGVVAHWVFYGSSGKLEREPEPVIERFTMRDRRVNQHVKSIVQPQKVKSRGRDAHWFYYQNDLCAVDEYYRPIPPLTPCPFPATADHLRINHYVTKSKEEMRERCEGGRVDVERKRDFPEHFLAHDKNDVEDKILWQWLPELKRRLANEHIETYQ